MTRPPLFRLLSLLALAAPAALGADLTLAMLPRYSPEEVLKRLTPMKTHLAESLGKSVELVVPSDFKDFERRVRSGEIQIAHMNPLLYPEVSDVQEAVGMVSEGAGGAKLRGVIIVRAGSRIVSVEDLRGKTVAYVGLKSAGGFLSQKITLEKAGIRPMTDLKLEEARDNKQENVILSVFNGDVDAGFINEDALHVADAYVPASQIKVMAATASMPNWVLSVNRRLPEELKARIRKALTGLGPASTPIKAMKIQAIVPATDADYDVVREAVGLPVPKR